MEEEATCGNGYAPVRGSPACNDADDDDDYLISDEISYGPVYLTKRN